MCTGLLETGPSPASLMQELFPPAPLHPRLLQFRLALHLALHPWLLQFRLALHLDPLLRPLRQRLHLLKFLVILYITNLCLEASEQVEFPHILQLPFDTACQFL